MPGFRPATKQKYLPQQPATDPSWSQLSPHHAIMTLPTKEHRRGWSPAQINGMLWSYQPRRLIKPRSNDSLVCTEGKPNLVLMTYGTCKGLILNNIKKNVLVHEISDKSYNNVALNLEFPGKKVSEQGPTTQANPHVTPRLGMEPGLERWEASALTTAPSPLSTSLGLTLIWNDKSFKSLQNIHENRVHVQNVPQLTTSFLVKMIKISFMMSIQLFISSLLFISCLSCSTIMGRRT